MGTTSLLLVDDHKVFREGLRSLFDHWEKATVVAEAGDGLEAVHLAGKLQPDLVIMDLNLPIMNGIDATREIKKKYPRIKVLALSMEEDSLFVVQVLKTGASGYVMKNAQFEELCEAIEVISRGEIYLPSKISALLEKDYLQRIPEDTSILYETLSTQERIILQMIADGKTVKDIAYFLGTSYNMVNYQRKSLMEKLQLFTVAELTKFAVRNGVTTLPR